MIVKGQDDVSRTLSWSSANCIPLKTKWIETVALSPFIHTKKNVHDYEMWHLYDSVFNKSLILNNRMDLHWGEMKRGPCQVKSNTVHQCQAHYEKAQASFEK